MAGAATLIVVGFAAGDATAQTCKTPETTCAGHSGDYALSKNIESPTEPARAASAPPPATAELPAPNPEQPRYEKVWYGYQTLIPDGLSIGTLVAGFATDKQGFINFGYLGFLLVTPIVHMVHANVGPGFAWRSDRSHCCRLSRRSPGRRPRRRPGS